MNKKSVTITIIITVIVLLLYAVPSKASVQIGDDIMVGTQKATKWFMYNHQVIDIYIGQYLDHGRIKSPAYGINYEKQGIVPELAYTLPIKEVVKNQAIRSAILNGYPYHTIEELGCNDQEEAIIITQMAIYDAYYHYDLTKLQAVNEIEQANRLLPKVKELIIKARNNKSIGTMAELTIEEEKQEWTEDSIDKNSKSKTYQVITTIPCETYEVEVTDKTIAKIMNLQNQPQTIFQKGEKFKVLINNQTPNTDIIIKAKTKLKTIPILLAKAYTEELQDYIFIGEWEEVQAELMQIYQKEDIKEEDKEEEKEEQNKVQEQNKYIQTPKKVDQTIVEKSEIKKLPRTGY